MTCIRSYYVALLCCIVTQILLCLVYGQEFNKSSLTFVIDDSVSMTDEIKQMKRSVDSIFETLMISNTSQMQNAVLGKLNDAEKPAIEKPVEKIRAVKGADVQFFCRTLRGTPKPTIQWYFQHKTKNLKILEERNEALLLKNVSVDDEGKYTCNASNIVGSQSYTIDVIVEYPPTIKEDGIKTIETKDGDEVILPCNVDGLPTPKVRWLRNGTILPNSKNILTTSDFSLKITAIGMSDTGSYTCEAENPIGSSTKSVDVYVFEKPAIEKPVEKIRAVKGADVQFFCRTLRGTPKPTIQWYFQHKTKNLKILEERNEALLLKNVSVDDEGKYTCNASNIVGSQSYTIDVIVEYPPTIKEDGIKTIETKDGDEVILPCNVDGLPTPKVRWLRNGTILPNSKNILTTSDFSLKITAIGMSDTGSYTCEAENPIGSSTKSVDVYVFEKPAIEKPVEKIRAVKGADVQFFCRTLRGTPKPTIQWYFQHKTKNLKILEERNEALLLKNVSVDDEGKYTCNVSNIVGSQSYTIDVIIEYPPTIKEDGIKTIETKVGDKVILPCNVDGLPTPKVRWLRNGTTLPNSKNILTTSDFSLKITAIGMSDTGSYTCEAENPIGSSTKSVDVYVFEKPAIEKPVEKIRAVKGADVQFFCRTLRGTPKPTIQWYFQHKTKNLKILEERNEALLLKNVSVDDEGKYTCNASNIVGSQSYTIDVTVEYPPTIKEDGIKTIETKVGHEVILPCNVDGLPTPKVRWLRNGTILPNSKNILTTSDFSLKITAIGMSDTGSYTCEAENPIGSSTKSVDVYVFEKPAIEKPVEKIRAVKGADVQFFCRTLRGTPKPTIQWYFQHKTKNLKILEERNEALLLKNVSVDDEGKYTCNASNIVGSQSYTIDVIVEYPPTIKEDGIKTIETKDGDEVILPCNVDGLPTPKVRWLRNGTILPNSKNILTTSDFSLKITAIGMSDTGSYTCEAENPIGSSTKSVDVYVFEKPAIEKPVEKIRAVKGADVQFFCRTLRGTPKPTIQWYFQHKTKNLKILEERNEALLLKNVSVDDEGKYTCNVSNIVGSQSYTIDVIVEYPPTIKEDGIKTIETKDGDEVILPCNVDGLPTPKVRWLRNGTILPNSKNILTTSDFSLKITAIGMSDTGSYTCEAENPIGSSTKSVDVYVFDPPLIQTLYAVKTFTCVTGDLGLRIQCKATGYPKPSIVWKKDDINIVSGSEWFDIDEGALIIKNIEKRQQGNYTCLATNRIGSDSSVYTVIVNDYPIVSKIESPMIISPGTSLDVPCNIKHKHTDVIRWYKDSRLIAYGKLTLKNISYLDSGIYSCRVSDMWQSSSSHVELKIVFKPSFYTNETETIQFKKGGFYPLSCLAKGNPEPKATWTYNGKTLSVSSMIYTIEMTIKNRGKYTCKISNSLGSIERSFRIISPDCILEIKKDFLHNNQPMMLTPSMKWPLFPIDDGFMLIEEGEVFYLHCPENFVKFPVNYIRAFCVGETQIQINGNIYEHSEIKCKKEIKPVLNEQTTHCLFGNGVNVEVGYQIFDNFLNVYTVCLDTKNNVPLYTRHILTPNQYNVSTNITVWWPTHLSPYHFDTIYNCKNQTHDISLILETPFHFNDTCCFGKRQLVSSMDLKPGIPASTAYTYLNVVPHWSTCNSKNWAEIEQKVRSLAKLLNTELTVLTGTVKPLQMRGRRGYRKIIIRDGLGKKLSVAQYLWKVVQDPASASSLAIIQVNAPDLSPKDIPILIRCKDICEEIEWMKGTNWRNVADGYTFCCSILDFETAFNYKGEFSRGKTGVLKMRSDTALDKDYSYS